MKIQYIVAYLLGICVGAWIWGPLSDNSYEHGVKDCMNNRAKIEIKQDTLITR